MFISNMCLEYFVKNYTVNFNNAVKSACNKSTRAYCGNALQYFVRWRRCVLYTHMYTTTPRAYYILCVLRCITVLVVRAKIVFDRQR
jgi:hypothetical protein